MATSHFPDAIRGRIAYDGTRTPVKTGLFLIVCLAWLIPGLIGHDPWKGDEAIAFGIVSEMLRLGDWSALQVAGESYPGKAPLFFWLAAGLGRLLQGWMPLHDAARLATGVFMSATLACVSLAAFELMGERAMRIGVLLFIGCLGLLIRAHEMNSDVAGLTGIALGVYGLALSLRRKRLPGVLLGLGLGIAFLGDGFLPLALLASAALTLPLAAPAWRTRSFAITLGIALLCAVPLLALWPALLAANPQVDFAAWMSRALQSRWSGDGSTRLADTVYFAKILPWYAWPAWPLAAWSLWRARNSLAARPDLQMPFVAFLAFLAVLSFFAEPREINALPLLLPLSLLGVAEIDSLKRGAASALDWFGVTTFFLIAVMIWVMWVAALTGSPEAVAVWIQREIPNYKYPFRFLPFAFAALLTLIWLVVVARSLRTTRRALVNWAAGITMVWMLVMTLGVPAIDQARSYRSVGAAVAEKLPTGYMCAIGVNVGDAQRALLNRYAGIFFQRPEGDYAPMCKVRIVQASPDRIPAPEPGWTELWRGGRPGDKTELFVLYQRS